MGAEHAAHRRDNISGGIQYEPLNPNRDQIKKYQKDAPKSSYARLATQRPKLLNEVQDTLRNHKGVSKLFGSSGGNKLPTYQLLRSPGVYYQGQWNNSQQNGRGVIRAINGTYLESHFVNGKAEGHGILIYPDGSYYTGDFRNGAFNGKGQFLYKLNKMNYEGQWRDGKPHGKGQQNFPDIGQYSGQFVNGLKQGYGVMRWIDGRVYQGNFHQGYMNGEGVLKKNKGYYKGQFLKNNKLNGRMKTELGEYDGNFVFGQMSGNGRFVWQNGNIYQGEFRYNKMHGRGTMILKNGQRFTGEWNNGVNVKIDQ